MSKDVTAMTMRSVNQRPERIEAVIEATKREKNPAVLMFPVCHRNRAELRVRGWTAEL
jgi:hypothetical protein